MKIKSYRRILLVCSLAMFGVPAVTAQTYNAYSGGYSTGYGTVYGSFGLAMATQNMYNTSQLAMQKAMARQAMINKWGLAAVEKAEREAAGRPSAGKQAAVSNPKIVVPPPPVVRNYGVFRPAAAVDTEAGTAFANALGETAEEKALIMQIYTSTKGAYEKERIAKGWKNNIAGGLTFFTVAAMAVYNDGEEPSDAAADAHYALLNTVIDETPAFASVSDRDKQNFNNMAIGFGGLLLAGYLEGKQNNDSATIETYPKLAGELIKLVLKTEPANLKLENDRIVIK